MGLIRVFFALSVVVWHIPFRTFTLLDAQVAVLFFFITSGFYMALTINEVYAPKGGSTRLGWRRRFYLSRILRLYPAYLVTVAAMVLWFGVTATPNVFLNHPKVPFLAFLGLAFLNVFIVGQDFFQTIINSVNQEEVNGITRVVTATMPPHFLENIWMLVGQAWSLGSELLFYAIAPFVVRSVKRIIFCMCMGLTIRWWIIFGLHGFASTIWGYNFFPATFCLFCLGSLCYHLYPRLREHFVAKAAGGAITAGFAVFASVSILRWHGILAVGPGGLDTWRLWAAYVLYALSLPLLFCYWRKNRVDRWIGELSYPLYLVHGAIIGLIFAHSKAGEVMKELMVVMISVAVAATIFILIDKPVDAWRHRHFGGRARTPETKPGRRPAIRPEWIVLASVVAMVFTNTLRLRTFAKAEAAPAVLVETDGRYNIVDYDDRIFGIPLGDHIVWGAPGYDKDPRLIIGSRLSEVKAQIASQPNLATLLGSLAHYNIVEYDGRVFGVLQGQPITWGAPGYDQDKRLIIGSTESEVRARIASQPNLATLLGSQDHYNIVAYGGRVFGVLQGQPITWGAPGYDQDKRLIIGTTESAVRARIASQPNLPTLLGSLDHYNIVAYDGRVFGVLQGQPITWGAPAYDQDKRLIIGASIAEVRQRIIQIAPKSY
jgi:peptidoglycan/LPS O-acetylase OafA/YrhL